MYYSHSGGLIRFTDGSLMIGLTTWSNFGGELLACDIFLKGNYKIDNILSKVYCDKNIYLNEL